MPKLRPPFPAASGVFGQGSNVNNVESYHTAAWIMRYAASRPTSEVGTERNPGTMMFTVSGHVQSRRLLRAAHGHADTRPALRGLRRRPARGASASRRCSLAAP